MSRRPIPRLSNHSHVAAAGGDNLLDRLTEGGMLAPVGEVDKVLQTVLENLEITNNISVQPEIRARVMMTTPMESVYVG